MIVKNVRQLSHRALCLLAAFGLYVAGFAPAVAAPGEWVNIFASQPYTAKTNQVQWFNDNLILNPGQEALPLTLTVYNGNPSGRPFSWFRLQINGQMIATEKDLRGSTAVVNATGRLQAGGSPVMIEAGGTAGASMRWALAAQGPQLNYATPASVMRGQQVDLTGVNFSSNPQEDAVTFNGRPAHILNATTQSISVQAPTDADVGPNNVVVAVGGLATSSKVVTVGAYPPPVLKNLNYWQLPPGELLTIRGQNFAANPQDNQVYFGRKEAQIVESSTDKLVVIAPEWSFGPQSMNIPVRVVSHGVPSSNAIPVTLGNLFIAPTLPVMPGDASSKAGPGAFSIASAAKANTQAHANPLP